MSVSSAVPADDTSPDSSLNCTVLPASEMLSVVIVPSMEPVVELVTGTSTNTVTPSSVTRLTEDTPTVPFTCSVSTLFSHSGSLSVLSATVTLVRPSAFGMS